jgi:Domain of unknown function (DUF929)
MAKTKQKPVSAAQRREREKQQRQQRPSSNRDNRSQTRTKDRKQTQSNMRQWLLIGGVLLIIAIIIGAYIIISNQQSGSPGGPTKASSQVFNAVTNVHPNELATVGTGGVQNPLHAVKGSPPVLTGPNGKPEFFYAGGDYCPYCAAERWAIIVALSRFGTFSHLDQIQSAENNISTFTFYHSAYSSPYIDFVPLELYGNNVDSSGSYVVLQTPTADQQKLIDTYDAPPYSSTAGSIPFVDIANKYVLSGASYSPQVLFNSFSQSLSWQDIAKSLSNPGSPIAQNILGTANYLTAGICMTTHQQPASVCNTQVIQKIEQSLGKSSLIPGGAQLAVGGHLDAVIRREEI